MSTQISYREVPTVMRRHQQRHKAAVLRGMRSGIAAGRMILFERTPKDRGMAQNAWKDVFYGHSGATRIAVIGALINSCPYIGVLEEGARPHPVSIPGQRAIYEWVERHWRLAGGTIVAGDKLGPGVKGTSLTATKSRAHKLARANYLDKLSKAGAYLEDVLVRNYPDMGRKLVPAALNIAAAIIQKIRKQGQKPRYFVRAARPDLMAVLQEEVEREVGGERQ